MQRKFCTNADEVLRRLPARGSVWALPLAPSRTPFATGSTSPRLLLAQAHREVCMAWAPRCNESGACRSRFSGGLRLSLPRERGGMKVFSRASSGPGVGPTLTEPRINDRGQVTKWQGHR
jgi:hypothetical protein